MAARLASKEHRAVLGIEVAHLSRLCSPNIGPAVFNIFASSCLSAIGRLSPACQAKFQDYAMRSDAMRCESPRRRGNQNIGGDYTKMGLVKTARHSCGPCRCLDLPDTLLEGKYFYAYLYFVCKVILTMGFSSPCCQSFFRLIAFRS